jgi:hypothetical protein
MIFLVDTIEKVKEGESKPSATTSECPSPPLVERREFLNQIYYIPLPEDLSPLPAGKYKDFYCVTAGQECDIFFTW